MSFEKSIQQWVQIDNQLKKYAEATKELRAKKNELREKIMDIATEENHLPENNDAADGDSAQNNQQSAEQAPKPNDSQGSEDSTGQPSEQNSDQKNTGSASGKEITDSENLEKTGQKESQKDPVTPQEGNESEKEEQSDQAAAYLKENEKGEQQQMLQQWLRKVPDDPGQLLRNKMRLESLRRRQASELNHETDFW